MGGIYSTKLDIKSEKNIYKVSNNVFSYGKLNFDDKYINNICKLLDKGIKFVPYLIDNDFDFYYNIYKDFDNTFVKLNFNIFTEKIKYNNTIINQIISNNNTLINNENQNNTVIQLNSTTDTINNNKTKKRKINYTNIPTQIETNMIRNEIFKEINKHGRDTNIKNNLNKEEIATLKDFNINKPFKILKCDKNVGTILISNDDEIKLANKILEDNNMYSKTSCDETNNIIEEINKTISKLFNDGHINKSLNDKLIINNPNDFKTGKLKIQPKIHKKEFGIRQIISCLNHPTSLICEAVHNMINPFIKTLKHILQDSQQLIQETNNIRFDSKNINLYSCDFESLYSNIKPDDAIPKICDFLYYETDIFRLNKIDYIGFKEILKLIFKFSNFSFNNQHYLQRNGIPMGCICGPSIANLYVYILEKEWLNKHKDIIYYRFIDDIFIASGYKINLLEFKSTFGYLKLNIECNKTVTFLDLEITIDKINNKFKYNLHIKPTNTFGYLLPSSNHPAHIFNNIALSLSKRIRRICSSYNDYLFHSNNLLIQLVKRGYNKSIIKSIINEVGNINRESLIPYNELKNKNNSNFKVFMKFNLSYDFCKNSLCKIFNNIAKDCKFLENKKIMYINTINNNLGSICIDNFKLNISKKFKYNKCINIDCKVCKFSLNKYFIHIRNIYNEKAFFLPIRSNSNCESIGIIYIIICIKCNVFYIGESERSVNKRMSEHINSIVTFGKNLAKSIINFDKKSEIAIHFNRTGHNYLEHFKYLIFENNVNNKIIRRSIETDLINIFNNCNIKIINNIKKQPSLHNIVYYTFQNDF